MENKEFKAKIDSIQIEKLFGHLDYHIESTTNDELLILYGDNGCGKTTVLKLIFYLLSPVKGRGHKTFVANIPFKRCQINFRDGHTVVANRENADIGSFEFEISKKQENIIRCKLVANRANKILEIASIDDEDMAEHDELHENVAESILFDTLEGFDLGLFFLQDNRKIENTLFDENFEKFPEQISKNEKEENIDSFVKIALHRASNWAQQQILSASNKGEINTAKIYEELVKKLLFAKEEETKEEKVTIEELRERLVNLKERSQKFSQFGLSSPFAIDELIPLIEKSEDQKIGAINQVLSPYIRSFEERLNVLEELRQTIETFSNIFGKFYNFKQLSFDAQQGIRISENYESDEDTEDHDLNPKLLSSGEKQLLLLFCNVLLARSRPCIFIIDEPELSLNIKWQRELISSLISCVKGCDIQFVFATHSLEMLALHKKNTVKLIPAKNDV